MLDTTKNNLYIDGSFSSMHENVQNNKIKNVIVMEKVI